MQRSPFLIGGAAALAIVVGVGGFFIGSSLQSDDAPAATATASAPKGDPVPVIEPIALGDARPAEIPAAADGATPAATGLSKVVAIARTMGTTPRSDGPPTSTTTATGSPSAAPSPSSGTPASADDAVYRFDDPCASDHPPDDCPPGTVHSTILALTAPPPLTVVAHGNPAVRGAGPAALSCPLTILRPGEQLLDVITNAPVRDGQIHVLQRPDGAGGVRTFSFSTSAADRSAWDAALASSADPDDPALSIANCVVIDGLAIAEGRIWQVNVSVTDTFDRTGTADTLLAPLERRGRPPTIVSPWSRQRVLVVGSVKDGSHLRAVAYPVGELATPDENPCQLSRTRGSSASPSSITEVRANTVSSGRYSAATLGSADYPYNPLYVQTDTVSFDSLIEGTNYSMCVMAVPDSAPSFDAARATDSERVLVATPNRLRPTVSVVGLSAAKAGHVDIGVVAPGALADYSGNYCTDGSVYGAQLVVGPNDPSPPAVICDLATHPERLGRFVEGLDVISWRRDTSTSPTSELRFHLPIRLDACGATCSRSTEWYRVPLPDTTIGRGLCGESFGSGCDPPHETISAGTVLIRVDFTDAPGNGSSDWVVGELTGTDTTPAFAAAPRAHVSRIVVNNAGAAPSATISVEADRATMIQADLFNGTDTAVCARPGAVTSYTSPAASTMFTFTVSGLCVGWGYGVRIVTSDADGHSGTYDSRWVDEFIQTAAVPMAVTADVRPTIGWDRTTFNQLSVSVGGYSLWPSSAETGCRSPRDRITGGATMALGQKITIEVVVEARDAFSDIAEGACLRRSYHEWDGGRVVLRTEVDLAGVTGRDVTLTSPPDAPFPVSATVRFVRVASLPTGP